MNRISRDQLYIEIANLFAKRSTCYRANIGAVITYDNRIVSTGWNGAPAGQSHCQGKDCPLSETGGCTKSVHAEINALKYLPNMLLASNTDLTLYVSQSPCENCAKAIIDDGRITKVFFNIEYRLRTGIELLLSHNIEVYRITQSGYTINMKDNSLCE